jgi:hypothetical protein
MDIKRFGVEGGTGQGGSHMPFARAVQADGWLYVSGQVPMVNGEVIDGGIVAQSHQAIRTSGHPGGSRLRPGACGALRRLAGRCARLHVVQQDLQGILRRQSAGARLRAIEHGGRLQGRSGLHRYKKPAA